MFTDFKMLMLAGALALVGTGSALAAEAETPIISFHTTLYDNAQAENSFHFYLGSTEDTYVDIDFGYGPIEVEVKQAYFDATSSGIQGTVVTGSVSKEGVVRVYGDASLIDYLDIEGIYATTLDISALTNLEILNVAHNELGSLDLTPHTKLQAADLTDNPFNVTPLKVGGPKPELLMLTLENVGSLDQSFTLRDYPALLSLNAYHCLDLYECDPTGCPELLQLSIDGSNVSRLDVTKNEKLLILNIAETKITTIDVTKNKYLTEFYCGHQGSYNGAYNLTTIDVTQNPELFRLHCAGNAFTTLDVSKNPKLQFLNCSDNRLRSIDVSANPSLNILDVGNNFMDFATLPANRVNFTEYYYYQRPMEVARSYPVGAVIDLSDRVLRPESETYARVLTKEVGEEGLMVELTEDYYTYADGKITLLKAYPDSIYIDFANTALPDYDIYSSAFMVKEIADYGKDNPVVNLRLKPAQATLEMRVGIAGATEASPKTFSVDFGDGNPVQFTSTSAGIPTSVNVSGAKKNLGNIVVYVPEGSDLTALAIDGVQLSAADVTKAPALVDLAITNCSLGAIDLSYNNYLQKLSLDNNNLSILDLSALDFAHGHYLLEYISAANNRISSFALTDGRTPIYINLSHNALESIDLDNANRLQTLDLSDNKLTELDLEDCELLTTLNVADNYLSSLPIPQYTPLTTLNVSGNRIALPDMPLPADFESLTYAPQRQWVVPEKAPTVNLSSQWLDLDGQTTSYKWYTADGARELTAAEVTGSEGHFRFLDPNVGLVYCAWTHPMFPAFSGSDIYRTTDVETAPMPTHVAASFVTANDGTGEIILAAVADNTTVYVDWSGQGDLEQYILKTDYIEFPAQTYANAEVKVYTYDENDGLTVFSVYCGELKSIDASGLKTLKAFSCGNSGLTADKIKLPASPLTELSLVGASLSEATFPQYPALEMLNLSYNNLTDFDASAFKSLEALYLSGNKLTSATFDNPVLWDLVLVNNELENIDVTKLPNLQQLRLTGNNLSTLDVTNNPKLKQLIIDNNRFTFVTLPPVLPTYNLYLYANQQPLEVEPVGATVDLSSQVAVGNTPTTYRWFIDTPYYDDYGDIVGEELYIDDEYTIDNGVTTFLESFHHIMCVMTNSVFPNLVLYTNFMDVVAGGVENVAADVTAPVFSTTAGTVTIHGTNGETCALYTAAGTCVCTATEADSCTFSGLAPGIYIARCGKHTAKLAVK